MNDSEPVKCGFRPTQRTQRILRNGRRFILVFWLFHRFHQLRLLRLLRALWRLLHICFSTFCIACSTEGPCVVLRALHCVETKLKSFSQRLKPTSYKTGAFITSQAHIGRPVVHLGRSWRRRTACIVIRVALWFMFGCCVVLFSSGPFTRCRFCLYDTSAIHTRATTYVVIYTSRRPLSSSCRNRKGKRAFTSVDLCLARVADTSTRSDLLTYELFKVFYLLLNLLRVILYVQSWFLSYDFNVVY